MARRRRRGEKGRRRAEKRRMEKTRRPYFKESLRTRDKMSSNLPMGPTIAISKYEGHRPPPSYSGSALSSPSEAPSYRAEALKWGRPSPARTCVEYFSDALCIVLNTMGALVFALITVPLQAAIIIIGLMNLKKCPANNFMPIWVVVWGGVVLTFAFLVVGLQFHIRRKEIKFKKQYIFEMKEFDTSSRDCTLVPFGLSFVIGVVIFLMVAWFCTAGEWLFTPILDDEASNAEKCTLITYIVAVFNWSLALVIMLWCCCTGCYVTESQIDFTPDNSPV